MVLFPLKTPKSAVMTVNKTVFLVFLFFSTLVARAQDTVRQPPVDTSFTDYDELFSELDLFLDSLLRPRSFFMASTGITTSYLNYARSNGEAVAEKRVLFTPALAYYFKSGLGIAGGATVVAEETGLNPFQYNLALSYDYVKNRSLMTGISLTRYFTRSNLDFYTSPLQNTVYGYFTYRKTRLRPTVAASYGWGSRTAYTQRQEYLNAIRLRPRGYTRINTEERVADFSLISSLRYDFYRLGLFSSKDVLRITPQVTFVSGTQNFGFNQSSNTYGTVKGNGINVLYSSQNVSLDDQVDFQPLSLTGIIKVEYTLNKVFIQPQILFDYYFPATSQNFNTIWLVNVGVIF
jgi:hypothetical protein